MREVFYNIDKSKGEKKTGGFFSFGVKEDVDGERLWSFVKFFSEVI